MKTTVLKSAALCITTGLLLFSCIKNPGGPIPVDPPGGGGEGGNNNCCNMKATGTIEKCPQDSSLWFINANITMQANSPMAPTKQYVPVNLPQAYKQNGLTVRFEYTLLKDSVPLLCWFCSTPPVPYGRKIKLCSIKKDSMLIIAMKPAIYIYPEKKQAVSVKLDFKGKFTVTYPEYNESLKGWKVNASPDGTLYNEDDGKEYQYLFWEGAPNVPYHFNMNEGYCVKGSDTRKFLQEVLPKLGLNSKEYNDMIVFWLPRMMNNPYNLVHFATTEYTKSAALEVKPAPKQVIRVFMAYQPSNVWVKTHEPEFSTPLRKGFTVVEWGGTELPQANTFAIK